MRCRSIGQAVAMAKKQLGLAEQLGDRGLAVKCRLHLAYNEMQLGKFERARGTLRLVRQFTEELGGDSELEAMEVAARGYLERLLKLTQTKELQQAPESSVADEFYRQRPVDESGRLLLPSRLHKDSSAAPQTHTQK